MWNSCFAPSAIRCSSLASQPHSQPILRATLACIIAMASQSERRAVRMEVETRTLSTIAEASYSAGDADDLQVLARIFKELEEEQWAARNASGSSAHATSSASSSTNVTTGTVPTANASASGLRLPFLAPRINVADVNLNDRMLHNRWGLFMIHSMLMTTWLFEHEKYEDRMWDATTMGYLIARLPPSVTC